MESYAGQNEDRIRNLKNELFQKDKQVEEVKEANRKLYDKNEDLKKDNERLKENLAYSESINGDLIAEYKDIIEELKSSQLKWISIEEKPIINQNVLLFTEREFSNDDKVIKGYWSGKYWQSQEAHEDEDIFPTHWMPLPNKPN